MDFLNGASAGEAILFSAVAYLVPLLLGWWAFFSKTAAPAGPAAAPTHQQVTVVTILLGAATISMNAGGIWDAMMHAKTGAVAAGADFLWPPHIMMYASFLAMFVVGAGAVAAVARTGLKAGVRDPRLWLRQNPELGALAMASLYALLSVPGDAIWHEIFGLDLTAWSIPHVMLAVSGISATLCALGIYLRSRPCQTDRRARDFAAVFLLAFSLHNLCEIATIEWEVPGAAIAGIITQRPVWLYPVIFGGVAFLAVTIARRIVARWGATLVLLVLYAFRAAMIAIMGAADFPVPYFLPVALLGGVLLDVIPWQRVRFRGLGMSLAFSAGYLVVALPLLVGRPGLPAFTATDLIASVVVTPLVALALLPVAEFVAAKLQPAASRTPVAEAAEAQSV